ncbi:MAG: hypothetical protein ABSC08_03515 [Bryobacteraceae bacterium]|jgi:LacI family transcriptional regulator
MLQAVEEPGRVGDLTIVAMDLFPALIPLIRSGPVVASIDQRPFTQGRLAFQALHQFLAEGMAPAVIRNDEVLGCVACRRADLP